MRELGRGLWVTALAPRSSPGSALFVAQVRGAWIEGGSRWAPVARALLLLPAEGILARVLARGADPRLDEAALPVITPSLLLAGAELVAM